jgi:hypothetical protein
VRKLAFSYSLKKARNSQIWCGTSSVASPAAGAEAQSSFDGEIC